MLAFQPTPEFWIALSAAGAFISKIIVDEVRYRRERQTKLDKEATEIKRREQDRLDIAAVSALTVTQIEAVKQDINKNGQDRMKTLLNSAVTTRGLVKEYAKKADEAIVTSNGIKTSLLENGVKLIETKEQV